MSRMLQRKICQTKAHHAYSLCLSPCFFCLSVFAFFYLLPRTSNPMPTPNSFPDQWLFNFNPGSRARRKCSWISQAVSPQGQDSWGTWGQYLQHTCHRAAWQAPLPPPQGKRRDALLVVYHWHNTGKTKHFVQLI